MAYADAEALDPDAIPVIDIGPLRDGSNKERVAHALHAASQSLGFIYVIGHGIPDAAIDAAGTSAYSFFRQPDTQKANVRISPQHRGWIGMGGAKMQDDAKADMKESFLWGYQDAEGATPEDHPLRAGQTNGRTPYQNCAQLR